MNVLDLFSGIGGFSLGLERAGMRTVAFCEIKPFARRVLAKHWPDVPCYADVRELTADRLRADGISVDVICGGFPCQDISSAGKGAGIEGERSGLWSEYARIIGELRPRYVIVENVSALLGRGLDRVLGDLAALRYDAEWHCIPASAIGARHRRDRIWIVAHPNGQGWRADIAGGYDPNRTDAGWQETDRLFGTIRPASPSGDMADAIGARRSWSGSSQPEERRHNSIAVGRGQDVADTERGRLQGGHVERAWTTTIIPAEIGRHCRGSQFGEVWRTEPDVGRVAYGVPNGMDRIEGLGNAVVPQKPEIIGRAIMRASTLTSQERD